MPQWLQITLAVLAIVGPLLGVIWHLLNEKIREHKEACDEDASRLWDQIGRDSDSGMRKRVHQSAPMAAHVDLERRVHELEMRVARDAR
jgi:hypothetical protein